MRIVVLGAGRAAREVVRQALGHGDRVVVLAPDAPALGIQHARLHAIEADVHDLAAVRLAVAQVDAVVSAFGRPEGARADHYESGIANVLQAMAEAEVDRLVAVGAAGAMDRSDRILPLKTRLRRLAGVDRACLDDIERMERRILASGADWTLLRPVGLTDGPLTGRYRTGLDGRALPKSRPVSRADLAAFALKALTSDLYSRRVVAIAY